MSSSDVTIRRASLADCGALAYLTRQLGYESTVETAGERLERLLNVDRESVLVAVAAGEVAGWIHLSLVASLESDPFVEIRGLVVAENFRSRGIGARLVAAAEDWARQGGVGRVRVRSNVVRADARRFYERLGYTVTKAQNVFDRTV